MKKLSTLFIIFCAIGFSVQAQTSINYKMIPYRVGNLWGYSDVDRNLVITPKYQDAGWFSHGLAAVKVNGKWGYINESGTMVIPAKFTSAKSFRKGYVPNNAGGGDSVLFAGASLRADKVEICINTKGAAIPKCPAIPDNAVPENTTPVKTVVKAKTYSLPNQGGLFDKIVDDYTINETTGIYYIAEKGGKYGVFNSKFETIVPFEYSNISVASELPGHYLYLTKDGVTGLADANGKVLISPAYTKITPVVARSGKKYLIVNQYGYSYLRDLDNNVVIPRSYNDIVYDARNDGFVLVGDGNLKGYYFSDARIVQPKYETVEVSENGEYILIKTFSGKTGYVSNAGNEYFKE